MLWRLRASVSLQNFGKKSLRVNLNGLDCECILQGSRERLRCSIEDVKKGLNFHVQWIVKCAYCIMVTKDIGCNKCLLLCESGHLLCEVEIHIGHPTSVTVPVVQFSQVFRCFWFPPSMSPFSAAYCNMCLTQYSKAGSHFFVHWRSFCYVEIWMPWNDFIIFKVAGNFHSYSPQFYWY